MIATRTYSDTAALLVPGTVNAALVGKFMMTHSIAGTWALFDEDITPHMGTIGAQFEMQRQAMELALRQAEEMTSHAWRAYGEFAAMLGRAGVPGASAGQKKT